MTTMKKKIHENGIRNMKMRNALRVFLLLFCGRHFRAIFFIVTTSDVKDVVAPDQHFAQVARQRTVDVLFRVGQLQWENTEGI